MSFPSLASGDYECLIAPFLVEEIKEAVWSCEGNYSPDLGLTSLSSTHAGSLSKEIL